MSIEPRYSAHSAGTHQFIGIFSLWFDGFSTVIGVVVVRSPSSWCLAFSVADVFCFGRVLAAGDMYILRKIYATNWEAFTQADFICLLSSPFTSVNFLFLFFIC